MRGTCIVLLLAVLAGTSTVAQSHVSVPVDHPVYYLLDAAEARGLCAPLPSVRPLTRGRIVEAIGEILAAEPGRYGGLSGAERGILEDARAGFAEGEPGFDPWKGKYRFSVQGKNGTAFSGDFGVKLDSLFSAAYYREKSEAYTGTDTWGTFYFAGGLGGNLSFNVDVSAGLIKAPRSYLGEYDTYAPGLDPSMAGKGYINRTLKIYSQPDAYFPYTYKKRWDGFIFGPGNISASGMESWPENFSIGPGMQAELSGYVLDGMLLLRAGRFQREWGVTVPGNSLVLNGMARPFTGVEAVFNPVPWFAFSSLTGILEYDGASGSEDSDWNFQNAFSIQQLEFNAKNYFHADFGSTALWPKRFELGYLFPLLDNFYYQNFIGDHDNMSVFLNIKGRYPGIGGIWFSVHIDEVEMSSMGSLFNRDRHMFAYQAGLQGIVPGLPFASLSLSYTKIEPYNYTHTRNFVPWYSGGTPMDTSYTNNGVSLGYYLPPNSDELKVRFEARPWVRTAGHFQYQMIRHGAGYGPHQVDGSSLASELDPSGRGEKKSLGKSFLQDGAYQWFHIFKVGAEHRFGSLPLTVFGETGLVYSFFSDISDEEYNRYNPPPEDPGRRARNGMEGEYVTSTAFILTLGFKLFW